MFITEILTFFPTELAKKPTFSEKDEEFFSLCNNNLSLFLLSVCTSKQTRERVL